MLKKEITALFKQSFSDLIFQAATVHRQHFDPNEVQCSTLLSIKTGACPEDCKYCSQSGHYKTGLQKEKLLPLPKIIEAAKQAKAAGATRFCMGAAWRKIPKQSMPALLQMIQAVKQENLETCVTLGMLDKSDAQLLKKAGLDYYNHNLDTSKEYYPSVVTSHSYQDRIETLQYVRDAGIRVCSGGILGLGESRLDRISLIETLSELDPYPESVPINKLVPIQGTPFETNEPLDDFEFVRTIAVARIVMPRAKLRLSAGRTVMSDTMQALCFLAGANSIFYGDRLLTTKNPALNRDRALFSKLGITASELSETAH